MSEEGVDYRGYHLDVHRFGPGWRVRVYGPGDLFPMHQAPSSPREDGRDQVLRQARNIVDQHIRAMESPPRVADAPPTEWVRPGRSSRWRSLFGRAKKP